MSSRARTLTQPATALAADVGLVLLFANLTAVAGRIAITLPFSPVPITVQTLIVLLAGASLGARRGAASQIAYVVEGAIGVPVFAGGTAGLAILFGPTGGYLVGFVAAAACVGLLVERGAWRSVWTSVAAMILGSATVYLFGVGWLVHFVPGGLPTALVQGVVPFVPGDLLKSLIAAGVVPSARWTISRWMGDR